VEDHKKELQQKVVAYINTDGNGRGFLGAGGSHSLQAMVKEVAGTVKDPQTGVSIKERKIARQMVSGGDDTFNLYALGSGSDYTPFIQHAGIASLNLGFGGENGGGEYHTIYDTYPHYKRFKDPNFAYGVALANTAGRITLRLANADVLPFDFKEWYTTVSGYWEEIKTDADQMRKAVEKHNKLVKSNAFVLASDPQKEFNEPLAKKDIPYLNFAPVQNELASLNTTIKMLSLANGIHISKTKQEVLNQKLIGAERMLTAEKGLPRRPWFKHQIYAPGFYTGYGVKTLPGVREAIEQKDWKEAQEQITVLSNTLQSFNNFLAELNTLIK
ncbi:MAG: N-acetylated-alpha-linked acidic dipeptidase, partial [Maribacter sp.]